MESRTSQYSTNKMFSLRLKPTASKHWTVYLTMLNQIIKPTNSHTLTAVT